MKTLLSKLTESIGDKIAVVADKNKLNENKSFAFKINKYSDISLNFSKFMNDLKNRDKNLYDAINEYITNHKSEFNNSIIENPENDNDKEVIRRRNRTSINNSTRARQSSSSCGGSSSYRRSSC